MSLLNSPVYRGRWLDTREITTILKGGEYASQEEIARVRQALRRLEEAGEVDEVS